jgi:RimJ/RimL family protein N-acetyltransferase
VEGATVVSSPPELAGRLTEAFQGLDDALGLVADRLKGGPRWATAQILPPYDLYYLSAPDFRPADGFPARELAAGDREAFDRLVDSCPRRERDLANVQLEHPAVFGCELGGELVSAASLIFLDEQLADVGVLTHPDHRGRGFGTAAVSALCRWGLRAGRVLQYSFDSTHAASRRLAEALGFTKFGVEERLLVDC